MSDDELPTPRPISPGDPDPENVLFVALGVIITLLAIYRLTQIV